MIPLYDDKADQDLPRFHALNVLVYTFVFYQQALLYLYREPTIKSY